VFGNPVLADSLGGEFEDASDNGGFTFVDPLPDVRVRAVAAGDLDVVVDGPS